jgi:hypothetical protein
MVSLDEVLSISGKHLVLIQVHIGIFRNGAKDGHLITKVCNYVIITNFHNYAQARKC